MSLDRDQGPNKSFAGCWANAGESFAGSPSKDTEEDGLRLVGPGVAGGDTVDCAGGDVAGEEGEAGSPGLLFQVAGLRDNGGFRVKGEAQAGSEAPEKPGVAAP